MKRIVFTLLVLIITFGLGYFVFELTGCTNAEKKGNIGIYFVDLPTGLDTIDFKAEITLKPSKKIQKIKFPNGGTETKVSIYEKGFLEHIHKNTIVKMKPLVEGSFSLEEEVLLNITNLPRGQYYVHYLSCGLGGIFPLKID
jgi:hypothetical protein